MKLVGQKEAGGSFTPPRQRRKDKQGRFWHKKNKVVQPLRGLRGVQGDGRVIGGSGTFWWSGKGRREA